MKFVTRDSWTGRLAKSGGTSVPRLYTNDVASEITSRCDAVVNLSLAGHLSDCACHTPASQDCGSEISSDGSVMCSNNLKSVASLPTSQFLRAGLQD